MSEQKTNSNGFSITEAHALLTLAFALLTIIITIVVLAVEYIYKFDQVLMLATGAVAFVVVIGTFITELIYILSK